MYLFLFAGEEEEGRERQRAVPGRRLCLSGEVPRGGKALQTHRPRAESPEHVHRPAHVRVRQGDCSNGQEVLGISASVEEQILVQKYGLKK